MQGFQFDDQELSAPFGELGASTFPSSSQEAAVLNLLDFKDENILAWLTLLRSLQQGYQHLSSSQILSSRQIDALSLLKDSPDALVLQWLSTRRYTGGWWLQDFCESNNLHNHRNGRRSSRFNIYVIFLSTVFFQLNTRIFR